MSIAVRNELGVEAAKPALNLEKAALVMVDMARGCCDPDSRPGEVQRALGKVNHYYFNRVNELVLPNLKRLLGHFRAKGRPVLHVHWYGEDPQARDWPRYTRSHIVARGVLPCHVGLRDYQWMPGLEPAEGEFVIHKRCISAFNGSSIEAILHHLGVEHLVMGGVTTNYGVGHCALDAVDRNFVATIVEDGTAAFSQETQQRFLALNAEYYFRVLSTDDILAELV